MTRSCPIAARVENVLWGSDLGRMPAWRARSIWLGRGLHALARDLGQGQLRLHAMSLVYTTLLSLVPLLAVSFSVLKGFGVHNQIEPLLANALYPLGDAGREITAQLIGFVDRMQVGVLGSLGLAMLFYTVISLIQKIEQAFNHVWHVTEVRPFARRFTQYLSVLTIGPLLFFSAVGLSASLGGNLFIQSVMQLTPMDDLMKVIRLLAPYLMISLTFAFVYRFVPNTQVRLLSALVGALVAGLLWEVIGAVFATFMAGSTQYTAIYSSLAILVLFMIWIYLGWLILLLGASVAFYHQHPELLASPNSDPRLSARKRERLALTIAARIARRHLDGAPPWDREALATALRLPARGIQSVLSLLEQSGAILRTAGETSTAYVLARAPEGIAILDLLEWVRRDEEADSGLAGPGPEPAIERVETLIEKALKDSLDGLSLRDLAEGLESEDRDTAEQPARKGG